MHHSLFFACLLVIFASSIAAVRWSNIEASSALKFKPSESDALDEAWDVFKSKYGKFYDSDEEDMKRKAIFAENLQKIQAHNFLAENDMTSFTVGINQFADMTVAEFSQQMNGYRGKGRGDRSPKYVSTFVPLPNFEAPASVDWRTKGYVTPVKDQGQCGSCWSFSTTGSLEGQTFAKTKKLVSLSEQNLVDCSGSYGNQGCNGGLVDQALQYIIDNQGVDTENAYPYTAQDGGDCEYDPSSIGATVAGIVDITAGNEVALMQAVAKVGPVSVAIDASHDSFQTYKSGIYNERACTTNVDHAVLVVGYGTQGGADYWIVKNSWNTTWGTQGYILMSRNKRNQCGIASDASYPTV